jgi:hypothetical protein
MEFNDGGQLFKRELPGETILSMMPIRELPGERTLSWLSRLPPLGNAYNAYDDDLPELVEDNDDDNDDDLPELVEDLHFNDLWFRHADFRERKPFDSSVPPILPDNDAYDDDLPELVEDNDDDSDDDLTELVEDLHFNDLWFRHADFRE